MLGVAPPGRLQLILFERGHWCASCRRHLALVADDHILFAKRRVDIVAITHESADSLESRSYPFPVVADPELDLATSFDVVGLDEFGKRTIRPTSVVVGDNNVVAYSYVGDDSRDRPTIPALILAIDNFT